MKNCPFCGAEVPREAVFCDQCGRGIASSPGVTKVASPLEFVGGIIAAVGALVCMLAMFIPHQGDMPISVLEEGGAYLLIIAIAATATAAIGIFSVPGQGLYEAASAGIGAVLLAMHLALVGLFVDLSESVPAAFILGVIGAVAILAGGHMSAFSWGSRQRVGVRSPVLLAAGIVATVAGAWYILTPFIGESDTLGPALVIIGGMLLGASIAATGALSIPARPFRAVAGTAVIGTSASLVLGSLWLDLLSAEGNAYWTVWIDLIMAILALGSGIVLLVMAGPGSVRRP